MGTAAQSAKGSHRLGAYFDQPRGLFDLAVFSLEFSFYICFSTQPACVFSGFPSPYPPAFSPSVFRSGGGGMGAGGPGSGGTKVCEQVPSLAGQAVL